MATGGDKILREKIVQLEDVLAEKDNMIQILSHNEKETDKKMKALNEIHSQKIKALLKSIQNLKKEV